MAYDANVEVLAGTFVGGTPNASRKDDAAGENMKSEVVNRNRS